MSGSGAASTPIDPATAAVLAPLHALFAVGPDTSCRTTRPDGIECDEVPADDLRDAFAAAEAVRSAPDQRERALAAVQLLTEQAKYEHLSAHNSYEGGWNAALRTVSDFLDGMRSSDPTPDGPQADPAAPDSTPGATPVTADAAASTANSSIFRFLVANGCKPSEAQLALTDDDICPLSSDALRGIAIIAAINRSKTAQSAPVQSN